MCGICRPPRHARRLRGRRGARDDDARADPPPRSRRRRLVALAGAPRRARAPPALDHRSLARPATSRCRTRTARSGSPSAARSTTTWSSGPSSRPRATATARRPTPRRSSTSTRRKARAAWSGCTGCSTFAIWDSRTRELHLARDRLGKKPLYYAQPDGRASSSAPRSRRSSPTPRSRPELDEEAFFHYLTFVCTPAPLTMFKGIRKLGAGRADDRARRRLDRDRDLLEPHVRRGGRARWPRSSEPELEERLLRAAARVDPAAG